MSSKEEESNDSSTTSSNKDISHEKVKQVFDLLDTNNDGKITSAECFKVLKKTGVPEETIKQMYLFFYFTRYKITNTLTHKQYRFVDADINMDGNIEFAEFDLVCAKANEMEMLPPLDAIAAQLQVVTGKSKSSDAKSSSGVKTTLDHALVAKIFSLLDDDSSGTVDSSEAVRILSKMGIGERDIIETMKSGDTDFDGTLDLKEFDLLLAQAYQMGLLPPLKAVLAQIEVVKHKSEKLDVKKVVKKTRLRRHESFDQKCAEKIFSLLDDGKGSIDQVKTMNIMKKMGLKESLVKEIAVDADINMDGHITITEFSLLLAKAHIIDELPPLSAVLAQLQYVVAKKE
jgi:Ca2+-binding EF-hand superfamily protein